MTPKQILDSFSETLMQDERILSARERALLLNILQHARSAANGYSQNQAIVENVIAAAVGESVGQRAFSVLGGSIVERILRSAPHSVTGGQTPVIYADNPVTPSPGPNQPQPPRVKRPDVIPGPPREPEPPGRRGIGNPPVPPPDPHPQPPHQPGPPHRRDKGNPPSPAPPDPQPQPPHGMLPDHRVAVLERPAIIRAQSVVLDEFLAPQELEELMHFTLAHEAEFSTSEVVSRSGEQGAVNYEHRRSQVLMNLGPYEDIFLERVRLALPQVCRKLGMEEFSIASSEAQITASNDGDFFRCHSDNGDRKVASRHLTFVYFFHREPRGFEGGELLLHDSRWEEDRYVQMGDDQTIVPQQNQIVFFPCELLHEITPVKCSSGLFADSRFTLNGWLHQ